VIGNSRRITQYTWLDSDILFKRDILVESLRFILLFYDIFQPQNSSFKDDYGEHKDKGNDQH